MSHPIQKYQGSFKLSIEHQVEFDDWRMKRSNKCLNLGENCDNYNCVVNSDDGRALCPLVNMSHGFTVHHQVSSHANVF